MSTTEPDALRASGSSAPPSNGLTRREELLGVATKLFAARGYHGTRMDDVADAVGLNKATVYHYYASKSLILFDICKSAADFTVWFTEEQVAYIRKAETSVYEHVRDVIDRGIASGEFYDCDSHVLALGYIGMTLGSYRWLRPQGRRTAQEIAVEFSTALLRGLIKDDVVRTEEPLGIDAIP